MRRARHSAIVGFACAFLVILSIGCAKPGTRGKALMAAMSINFSKTERVRSQSQLHRNRLYKFVHRTVGGMALECSLQNMLVDQPLNSGLRSSDEMI